MSTAYLDDYFKISAQGTETRLLPKKLYSLGDLGPIW